MEQRLSYGAPEVGKSGFLETLEPQREQNADARRCGQQDACSSIKLE
jgi:hypothetical protein